jgi:hypothetical protein
MRQKGAKKNFTTARRRKYCKNNDPLGETIREITDLFYSKIRNRGVEKPTRHIQGYKIPCFSETVHQNLQRTCVETPCIPTWAEPFQPCSDKFRCQKELLTVATQHIASSLCHTSLLFLITQVFFYSTKLAYI